MKWLWIPVIIILNILVYLIILLMTNVVHTPTPTLLKGVNDGTTNTEASEYTEHQKPVRR